MKQVFIRLCEMFCKDDATRCVECAGVLSYKSSGSIHWIKFFVNSCIYLRCMFRRGKSCYSRLVVFNVTIHLYRSVVLQPLHLNQHICSSSLSYRELAYSAFPRYFLYHRLHVFNSMSAAIKHAVVLNKTIK